jgi:3',5'-cyclic AMP phosphodiesterase CpdA
MSASIYKLPKVFVVIIGVLVVSGYVGAQNSLAEISGWEVYDHPLMPKHKKSDWRSQQGILGNEAELPMLSLPAAVDNFGSMLVSRDSFGDGVFRFQVTASDFRVTYGIVLRLQDWQNYCRLEFNSLCQHLIKVIQGKAQIEVLPDNFCYVPANQPTWVDIVCQGAHCKVLINGCERLTFRTESWNTGRMGIFTGGKAHGVRWQQTAFYSVTAPPLDIRMAAVKKPYAYWCTGNEARVAWETNMAGQESWVVYGSGHEKDKKVTATTQVCMHSAILGDLEHGRLYNYTCYSDGLEMGSGQVRADPGAGQPFRFGLIGDNRSRPANFKKLNDLLALQQPDIVLNVGDIVEKGSRSDWDGEFFTPGQALFAKAPCFVAIGNHEKNAKYFSYYLPYPTEKPDGHYYAFRYGGAAFLVFDDYYQPRAEQLAWMEKTLASPQFQEADWRVVFCHQPAYSVGWPEYEGDVWKRTHFLELLEKYKVHFFFNGHTHTYERGLWRGTYHILSGGGGCGSGETFGRVWPHVHVFKVTLQYCLFNVTAERIEMICQESDGNILDRLVVEKGRSGVLDAAPVMVGLPARSAVAKEIVMTVATPELGTKKLRYNVNYDLHIDSYTWSRPQAANAPFEIIVSREAQIPCTITVIGMDEEGRVTRPFFYKIE